MLHKAVRRLAFLKQKEAKNYTLTRGYKSQLLTSLSIITQIAEPPLSFESKIGQFGAF